MKQSNRCKSVVHYLMKGPKAVEKRLGELENESKLLKSRLSNMAIIRVCLRAVGFKKITPNIRRLLRTLGSRTLAEIESERQALRALIGRDLRAWEVKETPPLPVL
jgi:hypothetical protein